MRKTAAAALAAFLLAAAVIAGPAATAGAQPIEEVEKVSCGTLGQPVCGVLNEVTALLAPLQPALERTGPILSDLGRTINSLGQLGLSGSGVSASQLGDAAQALVDQINALPEPLAGILDATGQKGALVGALQRLVDAIAALPPVVPPVLGPADDAAEPEPAPAPSSGPSDEPAPAAKPGSAGSVGSTNASAPTGFGAPVTVRGGGSASPRSSSGRVPNVPVGGTLTLDSLALPTFDLKAPAGTSADRAAAETAAELSENVVLPAARAAAAVDALPDDGNPIAVLVAISALLLAGGLLLDHVRKTRHVIPS